MSGVLAPESVILGLISFTVYGVLLARMRAASVCPLSGCWDIAEGRGGGKIALDGTDGKKDRDRESAIHR